ncbi:MAG: quinolinate synthase NadA [Clostridia bacterium]|nr:quinolinate synthase NadA [Clostridia bacterium]
MFQRIKELKKEKNAVILAHYYADAAVQEAADYVGDSFYLAKVAKGVKADTIVFCGVSFMGESAKILNPRKTVLMPDMTADCPMAHMVADGVIEKMRKDYDDLAVVCYVNSSIRLKAKSDVCVTSSNAVQIVKALPNKNIFFIPDEHLGRFVKEQVPEKNIILNDGYCPIHKGISVEELKEEKARRPLAQVLSHPEAGSEIVAESDYVGSTAEIIDYAKRSDCEEFIVCTEVGVAHKLQKDNPTKRFYFVRTKPVCTDMKKCTLEKIIEVLTTGKNAVELDEEEREKALLPLERMLEIAR